MTSLIFISQNFIKSIVLNKQSTKKKILVFWLFSSAEFGNCVTLHPSSWPLMQMRFMGITSIAMFIVYFA